MADALLIPLPAFLVRANAADTVLPTPESRMRFVLDLARTNTADGGGPFAAAVFETDSGRLLAAGVNRVVSSRCAIAHAEVLALSLAQQRIGNFDLGAAGQPACELVSSAEPCAMCLGAILWSGVRTLLYAADATDIAAIGFDEGPKHPAWQDELRSRGIAVSGGILGEEAARLLRDYQVGGGPIYNARRYGLSG